MTAAEKLQISKERDSAVIQRQHTIIKLNAALKDVASLERARSEAYAKLEAADAYWAEEQTKVKKYEAVLRMILIGKTPADVKDPLGEWFSMVCRFMNAAKEALSR